MEALARAIDRRLCVPRVRLYSLTALILPLIIYAAAYIHGLATVDPTQPPIAADFTAHYTAGMIVARGDVRQLYNVTVQSAVQHGFVGPGHGKFLDLYLSPPFVAYLYEPLAGFPYPVAAAIWTGISLALFIAALALLWPLAPSLHRYGFGLFLLVALSTGATFELLADGQDSALALFLVIAGVRLLGSKRDLSAGFVLGLGLFKPQLFLLFPVLFLYRHRWRALAGYLGVALSLAGVSLALVGISGVGSYKALLTSTIYHDSIVNFGWKLISLGGFLHALLPASAALDLTVILTALEVGMIGLALRHHRDDRSEEWETVYPMAVVVMVTAIWDPHMYLYDGVLLLFPSAVLFRAPPENRRLRFSLTALYGILWSTSLRGGIFGHLGFPLVLLAAPWGLIPLALLLGILVLGRSGSWEGVPSPAIRPEVGTVLVGD